MATYTPPDRSQIVGIPAQSEDEFAPAYLALVTGNEPAVMTQDLIVATDQTLEALTVVGFDANGQLVPAVIDDDTPANSIAAVGILVHDIDTTGGEKGAAVYRAGCFNPDALVWGASFADDEAKFNAFEGAPTPTNIIVRRPKTMTVPA